MDEPNRRRESWSLGNVIWYRSLKDEGSEPTDHFVSISITHRLVSTVHP